MTHCTVVTGAAGFIGSHVSAALLRRGGRVVGVDNFDPLYDPALKRANVASLDSDRFELHEADIRDAAAIAGLLERARPGLVVHIAAMAGVRPSIERPGVYADVNVTGLVNTLEAMRRAGVERLIFASSSSVYGDNATTPFAEDHPVRRPISPYAATKRAGEMLCETWARVYGLRAGMLRFFTVFGPAQRPDLAISGFMSRIARGEPVPMYGDGTSSRDYTYVDDVVAGTLAACDVVDAAAAGFCRVWNLGHNRPVALADMIRRIGQVVGREPIITALPMQPGDVRHTWADLTRAQRELGYSPRVDFDEGLRRQWAWMRASGAASPSGSTCDSASGSMFGGDEGRGVSAP